MRPCRWTRAPTALYESALRRGVACVRPNADDCVRFGHAVPGHGELDIHRRAMRVAWRRPPELTEFDEMELAALATHVWHDVAHDVTHRLHVADFADLMHGQLCPPIVRRTHAPGNAEVARDAERQQRYEEARCLRDREIAEDVLGAFLKYNHPWHEWTGRCVRFHMLNFADKRGYLNA